MKVLSIHPFVNESELALPFYSSRISAGFPSPAENYVDSKIDLNKELIKKPAATFLVKVEGDSMIEAGIHNLDILVVDRSLEWTSGKVVVAILNGEFTVKRLKKAQNKLYLYPENPKYASVEITKEMDFSIFGVVTYAIHSL